MCFLRHFAFVLILAHIYEKVNILSARMDLNHGPPRYKLGALPTELQAEITP